MAPWVTCESRSAGTRVHSVCVYAEILFLGVYMVLHDSEGIAADVCIWC